jgi:uncharacterized damage-inducible protein DinB
MAIAESILPELTHEAATTRAILERVPEDKADWKPHEKSMSLGQLSIHIATLLGWAVTTLRETEFDVAPPDGPTYTPPKFESTAALLEVFDAGVADARTALADSSDEDLMVMWSLKKGGVTMFSMPRVACLRTFVMNHLIHHRGQLSVYLRLQDVPLPSIYGPTADTPM